MPRIRRPALLISRETCSRPSGFPPGSFEKVFAALVGLPHSIDEVLGNIDHPLFLSLSQHSHQVVAVGRLYVLGLSV